MIWIMLAIVLGGAAWINYILNTDKSGAIPCYGCGQCAATGECVMIKKKASGKPEARLDKSTETDIISSVNM